MEVRKTRPSIGMTYHCHARWLMVNKNLHLRLTIQQRVDYISWHRFGDTGMGDFGIHAGCFVQVKDGRTFGPIAYTRGIQFCWSANHGYHIWDSKGKSGWAGRDHLDIVDVISSTELAAAKIAMSSTYGKIAKAGPLISKPVLQAAMDAGIKANPAYEEFVSAIVLAAFHEAESECSLRVPNHLDLTKLFDRVRAEIGQGVGVPDHMLTKIIMATLRQARSNGMTETKNESAPGSNADQKSEGGLSGFDESGHSPGFDMIRTIDKLHPATRAFLEAIYPHAPLRAVEFTKGLIAADFGERLKPYVTITVGISMPGEVPMWINENESAPTSDDHPVLGL